MIALLAGCPADDIGPIPGDSSEDGATTSSTAATGTDTTIPTGTGETDATAGTAADTTGSGDTSAATDSTTGPLQCDMGLDPADFSEVRGCAEPIGQPFCSEGQMHVAEGADVAWMSDPPHSGPPYPSWETWGEHTAEVVPRGNWVHNLEHGGVVLLHFCPDGCEAELDVLRDVIAQRPDLRILMTQDPELPGERFAAVSWTWVYRFDAPNLATLLCFVDQHEGHAPEDVP
jgi:hypothetical protein